MHFIVYSNFDRDSDIEVVEKVLAILKSKPDVSYMLASYKESGFLGLSFLRLSDCVKEADFIIVIGGDGTVLRAMSDVANACLQTPVLAINRGVCGFLTDTEPSEIEDAIDAVIAGKYETDKRMIFKVTFRDKTYYSLNEVVIYKGEITRPIVIESSYNNGIPIASTQADGAYVCTPTGSTAYSLSAGGPVVAPETKAIVLGAICAHTLVSKPYVLPDDYEITMRLGRSFSDARLMIDGEIKARIYDSTPVVIKKSSINAVFIKTKSVDFFKKLLEKLNRWTTTAQLNNNKEE